MKILHVLASRISLPPKKYGGTERVIWSLAKAQQQAGHEVRFLWGKAENLPENATVVDKNKTIKEQIGNWPDIVHFHRPFSGDMSVPYICTEHGNAEGKRNYDINTVFLSRKHASNHNADCFVYNGLDWGEYGAPELKRPKDYFHFLGKAIWPLKNLAGAVQLARTADVKMKILGGHRLNFKRQFYFYPDRKLSFEGMIGGEQKNQLIKHSQGLIFPVRWHEPFGLAIIESLYLGTPVFSTPFGSLPEIITEEEIGFLSDDYQSLSEAICNVKKFQRKTCHEYAKERFNNKNMALAYNSCYERVLDGENLNSQAPYSEQSLHQLLSIK